MKITVIFIFGMLCSLSHAQGIGGKGGVGGNTGFGGGAVPAATFGTVDTFTSFNGQTSGATLTTTILANGTDPASSPPCSWSISGTGLKVGASQGGLGGTVTIGATTRPALYSTLSLSVPDSGSITTAICTLTPTTKDACWFGYLTNNGTPNPTGETLYDREVTTDTGGNYAAAQIQNGQWVLTNGGYSFDIETNPSGATTHTGFLPAVIGQRYAVSLCFNSNTGVAKANYYIPLPSGNFGFLGSITSTYGTAPNDDIQFYRIGNNEGGTGSTPSFIEDSMLSYSSSPAGPLIPSTAVVTIPNYVGCGTCQTELTSSGTTVTLTHTAAAASSGEHAIACTTASTGTIALASTHNTWTTVSAATNTTIGYRCAAFEAFSVGTAADTLTATFGTTNTDRFILLVEANVTTLDLNKGFANATSTAGGAFASASGSPAVQPELAIAFGICQNNCYGGSGFSSAAYAPSTGAAMAVGILTSTSSTTGNMVDNGSGSGATEAVGFWTLH